MSGDGNDVAQTTLVESTMHAGPVDGLDLADIAQDVNEPIWASETVTPPGIGHSHGDTRHSLDGVRTAQGALDLMHTVIEEPSHAWISRETEHGPAHRPSRTPDKPLVIDVYPRAAKSGRANTFDVGKESPNVGPGVRILTERADRMRAVVTNYGPGALFLAFRSDAAGLNPEPNMMQIPDPATAKTGQSCSREIRCRAELWAFPAVVGTSQLVDVQDEYGYPDL